MNHRMFNNTSWNVLEVWFGSLNFGPSVPLADMKTNFENQSRFWAQLEADLEKATGMSQVGFLFETEEATKHHIIYPPIAGLLSFATEFDTRKTKAKAHEYLIIIDSSILLIGIFKSKYDESLLRVPLVRDKFLDLLTTLDIKWEIIGFNVAHHPLVMLNRGAVLRESQEVLLRLKAASNVKQALQLAYLTLSENLMELFAVCGLSAEAWKVGEQIHEEQRELVVLMQKFFALRFFDFLGHRSIGKNVRRKAMSLLDRLTQHASLIQKEKIYENSFEDALNLNGLVRRLLERNSWRDYAQVGTVDVNSSLAIIDKAYSEVQTYGVVSVTLWAALVGAVIGSLITIIATLIRI